LRARHRPFGIARAVHPRRSRRSQRSSCSKTAASASARRTSSSSAGQAGWRRNGDAGGASGSCPTSTIARRSRIGTGLLVDRDDAPRSAVFTPTR
jgi:hypothetical protein